jgi:hypothetical protein
MPWTDLGLHALALLIYPGGLALLVVGLVAEIGAAWALVPERGGPLAAARSVLAELRTGGSTQLPAPIAGGAWLLAMIAATQMAVPFNPVPAGERNLAVAAIALAGASWAAWTWGWGRREFQPRLMLVAQVCWLVAVLAPAGVAENLRPQTLGQLLVPAQLPVKVAAGILYLLCLPALLQLLPEAAPQGVPGAAGRRRTDAEGAAFGILRVLLWPAYLELFASLFFPPPGDDLAGLLRFLAVCAGSAVVAIVLAVNLTRRRAEATHRLYTRVGAPFAVVVLATAVLTQVVR